MTLKEHRKCAVLTQRLKCEFVTQKQLRQCAVCNSWSSTDLNVPVVTKRLAVRNKLLDSILYEIDGGSRRSI